MFISDIPNIIAKELTIKPIQVEQTINLLDAGNTVPFIARYRKEITGSLDEEQIRLIEDRLAYLRNLIKRQEEIIARIDEQGKLTDELRTNIEQATKLQELEDIYLPYKQKKRTRASIARERGLEPLATIISLQEQVEGTPLAVAATFVNPEMEINTADEALAGARDILAENIMEDAGVRQLVRERYFKLAKLETTLNEEAEDAPIFKMYSDYTEPVKTLPPHRILAMNRGEKKGCLNIRLTLDHEENTSLIYKRFHKKPSIFDDELRLAIEDGYKRLLVPAIEREVRAQLTEVAEKQAIEIFGQNLKQLLLQAPLSGHTVMGLDPGYRTGCKVAVVDPTGRVLDSGVIQVTQSDGARAGAGKLLLTMINKHRVTLISIGNGTASYETEQFVANLISEYKLTNVHYLITNEAGASVYSASKLAKDELPDYDVTIRGAISIARRVQDPLAELVKIDPKAIGVGQYQHDVNAKELSKTLDGTIESAVNHVGVNLNTASTALLSHVAGVNAGIAKNIVSYRDENGAFDSRQGLLNVPRLGKVAFTQCAGFLRIVGGKSPLDNTPIHPESYELANNILAELGFSAEDLADSEKHPFIYLATKTCNPNELARKLNAGVPTVVDILTAFTKPGRDPREDLPAPLTRQAIVKLSDIAVGTIMQGTVRNITDFGVFVDIGIKTAGLIHVSELSHRRIKHPLDVVSVGDILSAVVISIDEARGRIGLSLKQLPKEKLA